MHNDEILDEVDALLALSDAEIDALIFEYELQAEAEDEVSSAGF